MNRTLVLENKKYSRLLFAACFVIYAASYVGRVNYSAALAAIISEGLFTKAQAGIIGSVFFFAYGSCQILWGVMGDKVSPFKMITVGVFSAAIANLVMPLCSSNITMALVWGVNGISHSMLWSPVLRILANFINKDMRARACLNISASLPVGTITAYLIATLIIKYSKWQYIFTCASAVLALALIFFLLTMKIVKPHFTYEEKPLPTASTATNGTKSGKIKLAPLFISSGLIIAIIPTMLHGTLKEGVSVWVPTMLTETYPVSASFSVLLTIFLPLFNLAGAYIITPVYNKIFKKNELITAAFCMSLSILPLIALNFMSNLPPIVSVMLLAFVTMTMHAYNYMLITLVPVRFAKLGKTATVTGILNASAYAGCALSTYGFGLIADKLGWQLTIVVWLGLVILTGAICLALKGRWKRFCEESELK